MVQMGKTVVPHIKRDTLDRLIALNSERFGTGGNGSRVRSAVVLREPHEYCYTRILASNTRGKRIFAPTNIRFWILAANASIDFPGTTNIRVFIGGYMAYIRTIRTLF